MRRASGTSEHTPSTSWVIALSLIPKWFIQKRPMRTAAPTT
jgi:hypothetical protein